jgi:DNA-binding SARP family transcriptional activator
MSQLTIWLLGSPQVALDGAPCDLHSHKALALLAYLVMTNRPHRRLKLATFFWPGQNESRALAYLRHTLWTLRKIIGDDWFATDDETISLAPHPALWFDVAAFTQQLAAVRHLPDLPADETAMGLTALQRAVDLYRDDLLAGFALRDSPAFDDWLFFESDHLRQQLAVALQQLVQGFSRCGNYAAAIPYARRWLTLDPLHELAHRWLMQLYAWSGQRAAALRQYQACVHLLHSELATQPTAETSQLFQVIKANRLTAAPADLPVVSPQVSATVTLQNATILCAGFTELWEAHPDDLVGTASRMTKLHQAFQPLLDHYGARVEQRFGDQFLVIFGADPLDQADGKQAIQAANALQTLAQQRGMALSIGLHTGPVLIQHTEKVDRIAYRPVMGPVVNLAKHLQAQGEAGDILVSRALYHQTSDAFCFRPVVLAIRGMAQPVTAYLLKG